MKNKYIKIILLIFLLIILFGIGIFIILYCNQSKINETNDNEKMNDNNSTLNIGLTKDEIDKLDAYILDNTLFHTMNSVEKDDIKNNLNGSNLLSNDLFKLNFAFVYGFKIDQDKYVFVESEENPECPGGTGTVCIKFDDLKYIYKKIFNEELVNLNLFNKTAQEQTTELVYNTDKNIIIGSLFTGYDYIYTISNIDYNDIYLYASIFENGVMIGNIQIQYELTKENKYIIKGLYLNPGAQAY